MSVLVSVCSVKWSSLFVLFFFGGGIVLRILHIMLWNLLLFIRLFCCVVEIFVDHPILSDYRVGTHV